MKKKIVLFVILMMCVASLSAQWSVTPEVGMNVTKYKGLVPKMGYKAGAAVSYTFGTGFFSLQSGLYFVRRGTGMDTSFEVFGAVPGETPDSGTNWYPGYGNGNNNQGGIWLTPGFIGSYGGGAYQGIYGYGNPLKDFQMDMEGINIQRNQNRKDYIQLPILARFNWKLADDIGMHLAAGPYFAFAVAGKDFFEQTTWREDGSIGYYVMTRNPYKSSNGLYGGTRFDWGLSLNLGVEVKRVTFDVTYEAGYGDYNSYGRSGLNLEPKYQTAGFTLGYKF